MNTKSFLSAFNSIETVITGAVRMAMNIFTFAITEVAPLVAPLPPAFSIYTAMHARLGVHIYVAIIAAVAIEIIGMFSSKVSIRCYQWNQARNKSDQGVPQILSVTMTAAYFVVVLLLALTVELLPGLVALVIPGFVLIAISVYVNLAIHVNLEKLEVDKAAEMEARQEKNGLAAQIRQAKKDLVRIAAEWSTVSGRVKIARSELTTLTAELASQERAKIALTAELAGLENSRLGGQNGHIDRAKLSDGGQSLDKANETKAGQIETRRAELAALLDKNDQLTNGELAGQLGVSVGTIKNDKKVLNGALRKEVK